MNDEYVNESVDGILGLKSFNLCDVYIKCNKHTLFLMKTWRRKDAIWRLMSAYFISGTSEKQTEVAAPP